MKDSCLIFDASAKSWLLFQNPHQVVTTSNQSEIQEKLILIDKLTSENNWYAAGFISYEAATAFDSALTAKNNNDFPLLWFGLYSSPKKVQLNQLKNDESFNLTNWESKNTKDEYSQNIEKIKHYIKEGDTYQVNYTFRLNSEFSGNPLNFFIELVSGQQLNYPAFINTSEYSICSASPELFFCKRGRQLTTRPMKGTAPRGMTLAGDEKNRSWLEHSEKNRAENVMITDMIRNDLGVISEVGTVKPSSLFKTEKYPTVWQMTSSVESQTKKAIAEIMSALFPCASITGAPKASTMKIISELEKTPRKIYTGSIGFITPENDAQFNVAIRTVLIDHKTEKAEYGVGGGIVWDSEAEEEFNECKIKSKVLKNKQPEFDLLETLLWQPEAGYFLLDEHISRISDSAKYFDFESDLTELKNKLFKLSKNFGVEYYKVRILLDREGKLNIQNDILDLGQNEKPVKLAICSDRVSSTNPFLYHKTTNRNCYTDRKKKYPDVDDILLINEREELTESTIANLVIKIAGEYFTPALESGLLAGTYREHLINTGKIKEKVIQLSELKKAEEIFLINSVRKWRKAVLS